MKEAFNRVKEAVDFIKSKIRIKPRIGVILGSGLSNAIKLNSIEKEIEYKNIPHFPIPEIEGHSGILTIGKVGEKNVAVLNGRCHYYEGYSLSDVVLPTRVLKLLGVEYLIITGTAGAISKGLKPSDIILITDHINMIGKNPLRGENIDKLGERFPDMTNVYDMGLIGLAREAGEKIGLPLKDGIYLSIPGPSYETPAEVRMLKLLGADAVGMSIVPEAISAKHMGLKILGIAYITNMAAGISNEYLSHDDVIKVAKQIKSKLGELLKKVILKI